MGMIERPTAVGVFTEPAQVDVAMNELEGAGFSDDQIKFFQQEASRVDFIGGLKRLFKWQETTSGSVVNDLVRMGVPEEEARYYQSEFELGRIIIAVEAGDRQPDALVILRRNGAYDVTTRPGTYNPNARSTMENPPDLR